MGGLNETRIVLLGKTGSGKSSLGNTILRGNPLRENLSPNSETRECQAESKDINGKLIKVIDTPGFFDTNMSEEELKSEIIKSIKECSPGPHAFLIVLQVGRYTDQEKDVIRKILGCFSEEALKYAAVVFTHGDQLPQGQTIEDFVRQNNDLSDWIQKCGDRCYVVDNKYWKNRPPNEYRSNRAQVDKLLKRIETMKNNQDCYTNELLRRAAEMGHGAFWEMLKHVPVETLLGLFFGAIPGLGIVIKVGLGMGFGAAFKYIKSFFGYR